MVQKRIYHVRLFGRDAITLGKREREGSLATSRCTGHLLFSSLSALAFLPLGLPTITALVLFIFMLCPCTSSSPASLSLPRGAPNKVNDNFIQPTSIYTFFSLLCPQTKLRQGYRISGRLLLQPTLLLRPPGRSLFALFFFFSGALYPLPFFRA